jgi:hypothetical protein
LKLTAIYGFSDQVIIDAESWLLPGQGTRILSAQVENEGMTWSDHTSTEIKGSSMDIHSDRQSRVFGCAQWTENIRGETILAPATRL